MFEEKSTQNNYYKFGQQKLTGSWQRINSGKFEPSIQLGK